MCKHLIRKPNDDVSSTCSKKNCTSHQNAYSLSYTLWAVCFTFHELYYRKLQGGVAAVPVKKCMQCAHIAILVRMNESKDDPPFLPPGMSDTAESTSLVVYNFYFLD